jgi:hypothetical protein
MACFVKVESVDRIIYAIFNELNEEYQWKNRTLRPSSLDTAPLVA